MIKKTIITILGIFASTPTFGSEVINDYKAFSVFIGEGGGLSIRKSLSKNMDILFSSDIRFSKFNSKDTDEERYNSETSTFEKTTTYNKRSNGSVSANIGLRNYLNRGKYSLFWQTELGPFYEYARRNYYSDFDEDKEENLTRTHTLGLSANARVGVEYKFSNSMSLELTYALFVRASGYHIGGDEEIDKLFIGDSNSVSISYYW